MRPLGPLPAYTLGGGRQGTGVRPLSQAPASAASQTSRRGAVPAPCTQTLENYSPSLKGARYPSSMGDRLQRPFAGCDTGKPAPGAPPLTVLPPTAPPDAGKGTDWVFLGFGMAGGSRGRPPMAAEPDPVQPLRRRSPHGEVGPTVAVAPPHSGVKDFDFGPGGGLGSEGLDFRHDGVPDPVAAEIRDRHGAYPGLLPGDVPDPDLETRQPAGAVDARDLVSSAVRSPPPRKSVGPALFAGAIGPAQLPGMTAAAGPDAPSRDLSFITRATQRSLGGGGGGGARAVGRAGSIAEAGADADQRFREANNDFISGVPGARERLQGADQDYKDAREAYRKLQRERNIGVSFEEAVRRAREQAAVEDKIRKRAEVLEQRAFDRNSRAAGKRRSARERRFGNLSGKDSGEWRAVDYVSARIALDRARGEYREVIRDARRTLEDLRGKEDRDATAAREQALVALAPELRASADAAVNEAKHARNAAEAALAAAAPGDMPAAAQAVRDREEDLAAAERAHDRVERLLGTGAFKDLVKTTEDAIRQAEGARKEYEAAAERLKDLTLGSSTQDARDAAAADLSEKQRALEEAIAELVEYLTLLHIATQPPPPKPPPGQEPDEITTAGPVVPAEACKKPPQCGVPPCLPFQDSRYDCECHWEWVGGAVPVGGKGKVMGGQAAGFGGPKPFDGSAFQRMADRAPSAKYHSPDREGVRTPPDGAAAGIGPQSVGPFGGAPIEYAASPNVSPAAGYVFVPPVPLAPQDGLAPPAPKPPAKPPARSTSESTGIARWFRRAAEYWTDAFSGDEAAEPQQVRGPAPPLAPYLVDPFSQETLRTRMSLPKGEPTRYFELLLENTPESVSEADRLVERYKPASQKIREIEQRIEAYVRERNSVSDRQDLTPAQRQQLLENLRVSITRERNDLDTVVPAGWRGFHDYIQEERGHEVAFRVAQNAVRTAEKLRWEWERLDEEKLTLQSAMRARDDSRNVFTDFAERSAELQRAFEFSEQAYRRYEEARIEALKALERVPQHPADELSPVPASPREAYEAVRDKVQEAVEEWAGAKGVGGRRPSEPGARKSGARRRRAGWTGNREPLRPEDSRQERSSGGRWEPSRIRSVLGGVLTDHYSDREIELGRDGEKGQIREREIRAALLLEERVGTLRRDPLDRGDWVDENGRVYDGIGPLDEATRDFSLEKYIKAIRKHVDTPSKSQVDEFVIDLRGLSPQDQHLVRCEVECLRSSGQGRTISLQGE